MRKRVSQGRGPPLRLSNSKTHVPSTAHMAPWVRVKFENLQRSSSLLPQALVTGFKQRGFSFSLLPGAEIQVPFPALVWGNLGPQPHHCISFQLGSPSLSFSSPGCRWCEEWH